MTDWVREFFNRADALDAGGVAELLTEDVRLNFGNWDPQQGRETVRQTFADFYATIAGMSHEFINLWEVENGAIAESNVTYTKQNGENVTIPAVTCFGKAHGGIDAIRIYIDVAPLFA